MRPGLLCLNPSLFIIRWCSHTARKALDCVSCPPLLCLLVATFPSVLPVWVCVLILESWLHWGLVVSGEGRQRRPPRPLVPA